jgi:eukaryotic-like serine/threonine-protein kinase
MARDHGRYARRMRSTLRSLTTARERRSQRLSLPRMPIAASGPVLAIAGWALAKIAVSTAGVPPDAAITYPVSPWLYVLVGGVFAAAGVWLLFMGRDDRRAVHLGVLFLLVSTAFSDALLRSAQSAFDPLAPLARPLAALQLSAFLPFLLWKFVGDFPRGPRSASAERVLTWSTGASACLGGALLLTHLVGEYLLPSSTTGLLARVDRFESGSLFWPLLLIAGAAAFPYALIQLRKASRDERRRVRLVLASLLIGVIPIFAFTIAAALIPAVMGYLSTPHGVARAGLLVYPAMLLIPLGTAYAVLVHRALDVRLVVRRVFQYLLARYTLATLSAAPFVLLGALLYLERQRAISQVVLSPSGWFAGGALLTGGLLLRSRTPILAALDRKFFREQYDARLILGALVSELGGPRTLRQVAGHLRMEVGRALHVDFVRLLVRDRSSGTLLDIEGGVPPLQLTWSVARRCAASQDPVLLTGAQQAESGGSTGPEEIAWLERVPATLAIPVGAADGALLGIVLLGEKKSELPFSREDRALLSAIASSLALRLESGRAVRDGVSVGRSGANQAREGRARECVGCGAVAGSDARRCPACGESTIAAIVPAVLADKYQLLQRVGAGGMGVVYRGVDLELHRTIAIKTLPELSAREIRRLRQEARLMAAVGHPAIATIFGLEVFGGRPMLVTEFFSAGTLEDRLRKGALPAEQVFRISAALAEGLESLHEAGILHGDIKPSNIGFSSRNAPKLLDFGLARGLAPEGSAPTDEAAALGGRRVDMQQSGASLLGGTPLYLSPEALAGAEPDAAFDLWSLSVVMYEAIAGRHPLASTGDLRQLRNRIAAADLPDILELQAGVPPIAAEFLRRALAPQKGVRPSTARAMAEGIQGVLRQIRPAPVVEPPLP